MLSDIYNAPELENWHCSNECPLGKGTVPRFILTNADRAVLNLVAAYIEVERGESDIENLVIHAAENGTITDKAVPLLKRTMERANMLYIRAQEFTLWLEKSKKQAGSGG